MKISESAIDAEILRQFAESARAGCALLNAEFDQQPSAEIITRLDSFIFDRQGTRAVKFDDDADVLLGSLWGELLVRELGWEWSNVTFHEHNNATAIGVFSPDRALAIYPFHFVYGCLENSAPVTIELAFNMLIDGSRIPKLPAKSYENVMDNVHHVVPRS